MGGQRRLPQSKTRTRLRGKRGDVGGAEGIWVRPTRGQEAGNGGGKRRLGQEGAGKLRRGVLRREQPRRGLGLSVIWGTGGRERPNRNGAEKNVSSPVGKRGAARRQRSCNMERRNPGNSRGPVSQGFDTSGAQTAKRRAL